MARDDYLKLTARLDINSQSKAFRDKSWKAAAWTLRTVAQRALEFARENVAEGEGPGPHPHLSRHEDTGNLGKSLGIEFTYAGARMYATVYTNLDYGTYLEVGWKTEAGNFFRYPWLKPAYKKAGMGFAKVATDNWKREVFSLESGEKVMTSGEVDAYGGKVLDLLKPLEGWKETPASSFSKEFLDILRKGTVEPNPPPASDPGRTRRNIEASRKLADLRNKLIESGKVKGASRKVRHSAWEDNQNQTALGRKKSPKGRKKTYVTKNPGNEKVGTRQGVLDQARADIQQAMADKRARKLTRVIQKARQVTKRRKK